MIKCNPNYPINPNAAKVNGLTDELVKDWPLFPEEWAKIEPYFRDSVWIGYNSDGFDQRALNLEFGRYCIPAPTHRNLDVMKIAKRMISKKEVENYKLITMCKHFNIEGDDFHTADFDTARTLEVFKKLRELNRSLDNKYSKLFEPTYIEREYSGCSPKTKYCDDFDY